jgi:CubicO group peptidase (beta-lactamase class C family)
LAIIKKNKFMQEIESYLDSIISNDCEAGFAFAIVKGNEIIFCKTYGVTDIETKQKLEPFHIFHTASVSKTFVATAVMQLAEQGKIDIDDCLVDYVPEFCMDDKRYKEITIKQILNHTSGMPDVEDYEWEKQITDDGAALRYLKTIGNEKLISEPGKVFNYSNIAYDLLACLITKVSGLSFESFIEIHILKPLQMNTASFFFPEIKKELQVSPHTKTEEMLTVSRIYPYNRMHAPSSTLNTSVLELSNWAIVNLNKGTFKKKQIFTAKTYADMSTATTSSDMENVSQGLSWFIYNYRNIKQVGHSGSDLGFCSILTLMPEYKIGIVILSNNEAFEISKIHDTVRDILINHLPKK